MDAEVKTVTQQAVGFSFHVSVEREIRVETGAKYPDKTVVKAGLGGHADSFEEAKKQLQLATDAVKKQLGDLEK